MHHERIAILDFGSQYTRLITRRLRELGAFGLVYGPEAKAQFGLGGEEHRGGGLALPETILEEQHGRKRRREIVQLGRLARELSGMPEHLALYVLVEVAKALAYAHERKGPDGTPLGIVHRDVSPAYLLLSIAGSAW